MNLSAASGDVRASDEQRPVLKSGDVLDLGEIGMQATVRKDRSESGGRSFDMEILLHPFTGGTPIHIHPQASESYEVLEGKLDVYVDGRWNSLAAGEKITVEPGVPHTFRNPVGEVARIYNTHQPAMRYDEFFLGLSGVANSGVIRSGKMTFRALLALAVLWTSMPGEIRSVRPPHAVMRLMGRLGRMLAR